MCLLLLWCFIILLFSPLLSFSLFISDILSKGPYSPYPNPIKDERTDMDKYLESNLDIKYDVGTSGPKIVHPHGFKMQIRKSGIDHPAAGYGKFLLPLLNFILCLFVMSRRVCGRESASRNTPRLLSWQCSHSPGPQTGVL